MEKKVSRFEIDTESVRQLAELLKETGLSEIEYVEGEKRIKVAGASLAAPLSSYVQVAAPAAVEVLGEKKPEAAPAKAGKPITSPMVGTAYLSSTPGGIPFVKPGDRVKKGDTLVIIEAMKVMNPIKSTEDGEVLEVLVSDAKPVEFGETLVLIG